MEEVKERNLFGKCFCVLRITSIPIGKLTINVYLDYPYFERGEKDCIVQTVENSLKQVTNFAGTVGKRKSLKMELLVNKIFLQWD